MLHSPVFQKALAAREALSSRVSQVPEGLPPWKHAAGRRRCSIGDMQAQKDLGENETARCKTEL